MELSDVPVKISMYTGAVRQTFQIHSLHNKHTDFATAINLDIAFIEFSTSHGLIFDFWPHTIPKDVQCSLNALPAMYCC